MFLLCECVLECDGLLAGMKAVCMCVCTVTGPHAGNMRLSAVAAQVCCETNEMPGSKKRL